MGNNQLTYFFTFKFYIVTTKRFVLIYNHVNPKFKHKLAQRYKHTAYSNSRFYSMCIVPFPAMHMQRLNVRAQPGLLGRPPQQGSQTALQKLQEEKELLRKRQEELNRQVLETKVSIGAFTFSLLTYRQPICQTFWNDVWFDKGGNNVTS